MSDLSHSFKRAILAFSNADDFIGSFSDGGYMIAEDISDKMAVERKLNQAQGLDSFEIYGEIEGAVAFYNRLMPSFLILQVALLEDFLLEICQGAAQAKNIKVDLESLDHFTAEQAKAFFENDLGIQFPSPWPVWEKVQEFQRLRDYVVNHTGLNAGSVDISDTFLADVNKAMILYFEELQSHLPDI